MGGRIDVETDDVAQLVDEPRVGGELELLYPMRLKAVRPPDALDGTRADIDDLRHCPSSGNLRLIRHFEKRGRKRSAAALLIGA